MIIDTHVHLDDDRLKKRLPQVIKNYKDEGIDKVITIGVDSYSSKQAYNIARANDSVYFSIGCHPHNSKGFNTKEFKTLLAKMSQESKLVAIGEIGLDYYYNFSKKHIQKSVFKKQIKLADRYNLPIIIHLRDSYSDALKILSKKRKYIKNTGVIHCFSGDIIDAKKILDLGLYISVGGTLTFKKNEQLRSAIKKVGIENIVVETDSPYLSPEPYRGRVNEPSRVDLVVDKVSEIFNLSKRDVIIQLRKNTKKIFNI